MTLTREEVRARGTFVYYLKRYPRYPDWLTTKVRNEAGSAWELPDGRMVILGWRDSSDGWIDGLVWEYESARASADDGWILD
jgi:hypothetical protein